MEMPDFVVRDASLRHYNTFRFDYSAQYLAVVETLAQLEQVVAWANVQALPITCLGGGSNLLLQGNVRGLVVINRISGCSALLKGELSDVRFGGGMLWHECVAWSVENNLWGIENLALIPGTAGAAPVQNIGAYGVELKDVLREVVVLDRQTLTIKTLRAEECGFGYRESYFKSQWRDRYIIVEIVVSLSQTARPQLSYGGLSQSLSETASLREIFDTVCHVRQAKLPDPDELPNAGSFFKNPLVGADVYRAIKSEHPDVVAFEQKGQWKLAAGWLNDRAGWKGIRKGGVGVYPKQALVLVNYEDTKANGLLMLEKSIKASIQKQFGVTLEREPVLLGEPECH